MSDKYFPAKPDDVTCKTCPYWGGEGERCCRTPDDRHARATWFCGEHPWFVAQREGLRAQATVEWLSGVLEVRLQELANNLSK